MGWRGARFGPAAPGGGRFARPRRGSPLRNGTVRSGICRGPVPSAAQAAQRSALLGRGQCCVRGVGTRSRAVSPARPAPGLRPKRTLRRVSRVAVSRVPGSQVVVPQVVARPAATELGWRHHPPRTARRRGPAEIAPGPGERTGVSRGLARIAATPGAGTSGLSHPRPARRGRIRLALATAASWRKGLLRVRQPGRLGGTAPGMPAAAARVLAQPGGPIPVARTRIVVPAAPAGPATAARRLRVSVPGIRVAVPERLFATAAPAEQPAQSAAARVGRLRKLL